jgi:pyrroline-5-carboxylate reductase
MGEEFTLGVLGAGNMARAIVEGALRAGSLAADQVSASRRDLEALAQWADRTGVRAVSDNHLLASGSDLLLVGLKPGQTLDVLREISPSLRSCTLVISLAAGLDTPALEAALPLGQPVLRLMPNTPCTVGRGAIGLCLGSTAKEDHATLVTGILASVGEVWRVDEGLMDTVTAISGSGPAYLYLFMEALEAAGVAGGLDPDVARALVSQTVLGSAELARASEAGPRELRARVTSPGGTTEAAVSVLQGEGVEEAIGRAVAAAIARGAEIRDAGG